MAGHPGQQGGGHHGLPHAHDHGHYPDDVLLDQVGDRSYKLKKHEKENLDKIEAKLKSGNHLDHHELHEYHHFLEHFVHHIKHIMQEEHGSHIHNQALEKQLKRSANLLAHVTALTERH